MFSHVKETIQPVNVATPDPRFGQLLLEQFGGATGELTAALQYWVQSFHVEDAAIRDMLQDIALEDFSHVEMVGKLIAQHTQNIDQTGVYAPLFAMKGMGPHFIDSRGQAWTASYIQEGGNVVRDLRANISAEAGARQTYEALINYCNDEGTKAALTHLLTREITHAHMFMKALDSMGKLDDPATAIGAKTDLAFAGKSRRSVRVRLGWAACRADRAERRSLRGTWTGPAARRKCCGAF